MLRKVLRYYPALVTRFNNNAVSKDRDPVGKIKAQEQQVKEFLTDFIGTLDQPKERVKESLKRAIKFVQTAESPTGIYLDIKLQLMDEAIRDGHAAGAVDPRLNTEPERCKLAVGGFLHDIRTAVGVHLDDAALAGHALAGYADDHFENWGVMTTACVRIAKRQKRVSSKKARFDEETMPDNEEFAGMWRHPFHRSKWSGATLRDWVHLDEAERASMRSNHQAARQCLLTHGPCTRSGLVHKEVATWDDLMENYREPIFTFGRIGEEVWNMKDVVPSVVFYAGMGGVSKGAIAKKGDLW